MLLGACMWNALLQEAERLVDARLQFLVVILQGGVLQEPARAEKRACRVFCTFFCAARLCAFCTPPSNLGAVEDDVKALLVGERWLSSVKLL